jgi:hypothetical protein
MTNCTERSEGQAGMPGGLSMTNCTERSEGQAGMPGGLSMSFQPIPVASTRNSINSVKQLKVEQEKT